jgi:hypothetical protein
MKQECQQLGLLVSYCSVNHKMLTAIALLDSFSHLGKSDHNINKITENCVCGIVCSVFYALKWGISQTYSLK